MAQSRGQHRQPLGFLPLLTAALPSTMTPVNHAAAGSEVHAGTLTHHRSMEVGKEKLCNPEQITWALWAFTECGPHGLKAVPLEACGSLESQSSFLLCPPHVFHALGGG